jgi:hypothetical protein
VLAKTHTAAVRARGDTADHYVRRHVLHGACAADMLHVDVSVSSRLCAVEPVE